MDVCTLEVYQLASLRPRPKYAVPSISRNTSPGLNTSGKEGDFFLDGINSLVSPIQALVVRRSVTRRVVRSWCWRKLSFHCEMKRHTSGPAPYRAGPALSCNIAWGESRRRDTAGITMFSNALGSPRSLITSSGRRITENASLGLALSQAKV